MDNFCRSPFWDPKLTWYTSNPDFTECFQNTALVWIPAGYLLLFTPYHFYKIIKWPQSSISWNIHNVSQLVLCLLLLMSSVADLCWVLLKDTYHTAYDLSTAIGISILAYLLVLIMIICNKHKGLKSSAVLFFFWMLMSISSILRFRSSIMTKVFRADYVDVFLLGTELFRCPLIIASFLLTWIADFQRDLSKRTEEIYKCPEDDSSFLSQSFFLWILPLLKIGFQRPITLSNLWNMNERDQSENIASKFEKMWEKEVAKSARNVKYKPSVTVALLKFFAATFLYSTAIQTISVLCSFANPLLLSYIISFATTKEEMWKGILYTVLIFTASLVTSVTLENVTNYNFVIGMRLKTALTATIYKKSLRLSNKSKQNWTTGEIVNLTAVDVQRLVETANMMFVLWQGIVQIIVPLYILWNILGFAILAGLAVIILMVPANILASTMMKRYQDKYMEYNDKRSETMSEVLNGIKVLKLYAWENPFLEKIQSIRTAELKFVRKNLLLFGISITVFVVTPYLVALASFASFIFISKDNILTPEVIFVSLSLLNIMRIPMIDIPTLISYVIQSMISLRRLNNFMRSEEIDFDCVESGSDLDYPVKIESGTFLWNDLSAPNLTDINMRIGKGKLVAVVGSVGSGKSSLLSSLLGEMQKVDGKVSITGNVAYVPQQAWIQNSTVEKNILFFKQKNEKRYSQVLRSCALESDLEILPGGDQTEIGEKGINLSGGQKQRVSLARAVYNDADVYLFDDPLSAVDSHVGKHIFDQVVGPDGVLNDKTRVLVTHGLSYLRDCDYVYVMKNGTISQQGTFDELMSQRGTFADIIIQYLQQNKNEDLSSLSDEEILKLDNVLSNDIKIDVKEAISNVESAENKEETDLALAGVRRLSAISFHGQISVNSRNHDGKLIEAENVATGRTKKGIYLTYLRHMGAMMAILTPVGIAGFHVAEVLANQWLSIWSQDAVNSTNTDYRLGVYGTLGIVQVIAMSVGCIALAIGTTKASRHIHNSMLQNVIKSPMSFFDTTPIGRILNRFSRDVNIMDTTFVTYLLPSIFTTWKLLAAIIIISANIPLFITVVVPIVAFYYLCLILYMRTSRQLMRLESVTRSPVYSHLSESISGSVSIRAYKKQGEFISECHKRVDTNQKCYFPFFVCQRWMAVALQCIGAFVILFTCLFGVTQSDSVDSGTIGLVITYSISTVYTIYMTVRSISLADSTIISVERITEYANIEEEADWVISNNRPRHSWPEKGVITFDQYRTRYRKGLPLVLKGISFTVRTREKVGIVGRTGAGKSSLTLALFRLVESSGGRIKLDGIDISTIGLHDLRSKLTIIPQDPVLFSGTLRLNLDPFSVYSDQEIWKALELAHLKQYAHSLKDGLQHPIQEGGSNLSVGQRQLICLVRALLRKTKVLILDEATAAIDIETDNLIQKTIRKEFCDCTILTIAHRLNTIMDSDRVMVLDKGHIAEFDTPSKLLARSKTIFFRMAKDAGLV
ncbi:Uncharacterised protein g3835 [Pycnogonum litorale]